MLRNTVVFALANVVLTMILGTLVGLLMHRLRPKMSTFVGTCVMFAWATPALTGAVVWKWIFDDTSGLVTWLFNALPDGLSNALFGRADWTGYGWFNDPLMFFAILTLVIVWHSFPFIAVSVLAGLKSVPSELHEAARVDGAGPWRTFWSVTFPLLRPVFGILVVLSTIWDFKVFTQYYVLAGGTQDRPTYLLGVYSYVTAFSPPPKYGLGAAIAVVLTLILLLVTGAVRARADPSGGAVVRRAALNTAGVARRAVRGVPGLLDDLDVAQAQPGDLQRYAGPGAQGSRRSSTTGRS